MSVERPSVDPALLDRLLADAGEGELLGPDGLLLELTRAVIERASGAELTDHLGYEPHDWFEAFEQASGARFPGIISLWPSS